MPDEFIGRRVALRHRIADDGATGPRFTDAVGELTPDGPDAVIVHTRTGPVRVERDAVVAIRAVPPAPPRRAPRAAVARLERLRADAWPAPVQEHLGGWLLRAAGGYTKRANSALALADPGVPVERALERVREFAERHAIAPVVQAPAGSPWSNRVLDAGWEVLSGWGGECLVLVASAGDPDGAPDWPPVPSASWWAVSGEDPPVPGSPAWAVLTGAAEPVPAGEQSRATGPVTPVRPGEQSKGTGPATPLRGGEQSRATPRVGFGVLESAEGEPAAAVRAAVVDDHVYVARLQVADAFRRRGLAARLTRSALAWGAARGARFAMLDVAVDNPAGRALYAREGWSEHHRYHYLVPGDRPSAG
ncbi:MULTISPECIES: GNAT family N-acetyltransferase [Pseudonocardia]|nr:MULTISPECIES: GNAT family N-acetyltransferase [Pseudonocardia]